jgi:hypothetical protein
MDASIKHPERLVEVRDQPERGADDCIEMPVLALVGAVGGHVGGAGVAAWSGSHRRGSGS